MVQVKNDKPDEEQINQSPDVLVQVVGFSELAADYAPLVLDTYQRAYVWDADKVTQLLDDLVEFVSAESSLSREYYLGTILLHEKIEQIKTEYSVIDGQQRLTTLAILYWLLNNALPHFIQFEFRSSLSLANVRNTRDTMREWFSHRPQYQNKFKALFERLKFTVIRVSREDLAFTFFDTQNNRGVPLGSTDLLKAFHLRAVQHNNVQQEEQLQSLCARKWEQVQQCGDRVKKNENHDFAPNLFHYYLWRARNWRGSDVKELESRDEMLSHFGEQSQPSEIGRVTLYPARANVWGRELELTPNNDYKLTPATKYFGQHAEHLPFSLRQPISRGVGFFLYTEKYAALIQAILFKESVDPEVIATQRFYRQVVSTLSAYLQSLFQLALLVYVDRLGSQGLFRFSLYLDHRLGALRLLQSDIRRETPLKFLRDDKQNLLDVIAHAYEGDEVLWFLQKINVERAYIKNEGWKKLIEDKGNKVHQRYVKALASYYELTQLSDKKPPLMDKKARMELQCAVHNEGRVLHE